MFWATDRTRCDYANRYGNAVAVTHRGGNSNTYCRTDLDKHARTDRRTTFADGVSDLYCDLRTDGYPCANGHPDLHAGAADGYGCAADIDADANADRHAHADLYADNRATGRDGSHHRIHGRPQRGFRQARRVD